MYDDPPKKKSEVEKSLDGFLTQSSFVASDTLRSITRFMNVYWDEEGGPIEWPGPAEKEIHFM